MPGFDYSKMGWYFVTVCGFKGEAYWGEIKNNKFQFPNMGSKIKELDTVYTGTDFFEKLKDNAWNAMCDYAHSGTLQLSRRWTNDELAPNYDKDEVIEVLKGTRVILLMFTFTVLKENAYMDDADKINSLIIGE